MAAADFDRRIFLGVAGWLCIVWSIYLGWSWSESFFQGSSLSAAASGVGFFLPLVGAVLLAAAGAAAGFYLIGLDTFRLGIGTAAAAIILPIFAFLWPLVVHILDAIEHP